jgi:LPXTG-motif cell wall-anchored protein
VKAVPSGAVHAGDGTTAENLAYTGSSINVFWWLVAGFAIIGVGVILIFGGRRRKIERAEFNGE